MTSNNVLVLGPPKSGKIKICQFLTGDLDESTIPSDSHSGLLYNYDLKTKYYSSNVNLLIEEYPDTRTSETSLINGLETFYSEFQSEEVSELREALDGLIFSIGPETPTASDLDQIISLMCKIRDLFEDMEIFCLVVGFIRKDSEVEAVEDAFISSGLEFVNFHEEGKNEYHDTQGRDRLVEVLESHEWSHRSHNIDDAVYKKTKADNAQDMTISLMLSDGESQKASPSAKGSESLAEIFSKLKIAKEKSQGMTLEEKKAYVDELVEECINYL